MIVKFPTGKSRRGRSKKTSREDIAGTELDKLLTQPDRKDSLTEVLPAVLPCRLEVDDPTREEVAAINFEAVSDFAMQDGRPGSEELRKDVHERLHELSIAVRFSMVILAQSKPELIETARSLGAGAEDNSDDGAGVLACFLTRQRDAAHDLLKLLAAAEIRQYVATTNCLPATEAVS
jgi:hypothetical protein